MVIDIRSSRAGGWGRILTQIREVIAPNPRGGEQLRCECEGFYKLRVGDHRVIHALVGEEVLVLRIRHRGNAYG